MELLDCPRSQNRERQDTEVNLFWGNCFLGAGELPSRVPRQACREGHGPRAGRGWNQRRRDLWSAIYAQGDGEVVSSGGRSRLKSRDGRRESGGQRRAGWDGKTRVVELVVARGELGRLAKSHGSIPPAWAQLTGPPGPSAPPPPPPVAPQRCESGAGPGERNARPRIGRGRSVLGRPPPVPPPNSHTQLCASERALAKKAGRRAST